jgi:predicted  nucleic acid-binding Zn-ribbon protein
MQLQPNFPDKMEVSPLKPFITENVSTSGQEALKKILNKENDLNDKIAAAKARVKQLEDQLKLAMDDGNVLKYLKAELPTPSEIKKRKVEQVYTVFGSMKDATEGT